MLTSAYEDNIAFLASALTFDALLWILPLMLVTLAGLAYLVPTGGDVIADVHLLFDQFLPARTDRLDDPFLRIEERVAAVVESRAQMSLYGIPLFLWFSMRLFGSVRAALNEVFDTEESRSWAVGKALDLSLALMAASLIVAGTAVSLLVVDAPFVGRFGATTTAFAFSLLTFYVIYRAAPSRRVRWDTAIVAALVASLAFEVAKRLYGFYLSEFATFDRMISNENAIALLLFVLWVYYTAWVFLAGGEVADAYDLARRQRQQRALLA